MSAVFLFLIYITSQTFGQVTVLQASKTFQFVCLRYATKIWANYIFGAVLQYISKLCKFIMQVACVGDCSFLNCKIYSRIILVVLPQAIYRE